MTNRFGGKRGCAGGVSLHHQKLKSATVHLHSKTSLREASLYLVGGGGNGGGGGADNCRDGKVKVAGI